MISIKKTLEKLSRNSVEVQTGYDWSQTIPANGYKDYNITFPHPFRTVPQVLVTVGGNSTAGGSYGGLNGCTVNGTVTENGCKIRVYNSENSSVSPKVEWTAIAIVGEVLHNLTFRTLSKGGVA